MVLGSHVVFCVYGFWLPNDPRGSWSDFVGAWEVARFGRATKTESRRSLAGEAHDYAARKAAKRALKYPPVRFTGVQARAIGRGFARFVEKSGVVVWACSILPDHVHLVIARHRYQIEQIVNLLKGEATRQLIREDLHPLAVFPTDTGRMPKAFARGHWKVFLDGEDGVRRSIRYVQDNPIREGRRVQRWSFVTPFEGRAPRRGRAPLSGRS
jgi:REP element-mobilizing transposase RayT